MAVGVNYQKLLSQHCQLSDPGLEYLQYNLVMLGRCSDMLCSKSQPMWASITVSYFIVNCDHCLLLDPTLENINEDLLMLLAGKGQVQITLKSLQNVPKSPQITPEVPKSLHLGHIFLLGLTKTVFLHCPMLHNRQCASLVDT